MASSGISVSAELKERFVTERGNAESFGVKVQIKKDKFVIIGDTFPDTGAPQANWNAMRNTLEEKQPCFLISRSPQVNDKYLFIFYCPGGSKVRDRMVRLFSIYRYIYLCISIISYLHIHSYSHNLFT